MRRFRGLHPETSLDSIWSVASPVERALVTECCECRPENQDVDENVVEGALSRGKEATFVVLLARHCNTASMRALALAILERTIEQDEIEMEQEEESDNDDDKGEEEQRSNVDNKTSATDTNEQSAGNEQEQQGKEQQQQQQQKQSPTRDKDRNDNDGKKDKPKASRMSSFLAMGGLKILKQWFIEAITPTRIPLPTPAGGSPPPPTTTTTSTTTTTATVAAGSSEQGSSTAVSTRKTRSIQKVPSSTGPLLLPLLSVLERMPFVKRLVTETKINKQIRNLKKQVDELQKHRSPEWRDVGTGGNKLVDVQNALQSLMQQWQEKAKSSSSSGSSSQQHQQHQQQQQDPFAPLKERMKERLQVLVDYYEDGKEGVEKPDWMQQLEETERIAKEEKELSKLSTRELEERERKQERQKVLEAMQQKQQMAKARIEQLRKLRELKRKASTLDQQTQQQQQEDQGASQKKKKKKTTRRIRWKDGLDQSDRDFDKSKLEEIFVLQDYDDDSPATAFLEAKRDEYEDGMDGIPLADEDDDEDLWS